MLMSICSSVLFMFGNENKLKLELETAFFLFFATRKSRVFQIFLLRSIKAYLCPNIIHFDSVDFSERRTEEVISFF